MDRSVERSGAYRQWCLRFQNVKLSRQIGQWSALLSGCHSGSTISLACRLSRGLPRAELGDNGRRWVWAEEVEAEGMEVAEGRRLGSGGSGGCGMWVWGESISRALIARRYRGSLYMGGGG